MHEVKVAQAKAQLSALLDRVENGEEIVIARRGRRVARLVPEPRRGTTAAAALKPVWALGGFEIEPIGELPLEQTPLSLD
jgi:prevent-host-death family protein